LNHHVNKNCIDNRNGLLKKIEILLQVFAENAVRSRLNAFAEAIHSETPQLKKFPGQDSDNVP
jgi:hypothetical protein